MEKSNSLQFNLFKCKSKVKRKFKTPLDTRKLESMKVVEYAKNSQKKVDWATGVYRDWRNMAVTDPECDERIISADIDDVCSLEKPNLAYALCRFVTEIVKLNDQNYPPNTLREIVYCIQMYLCTKRVSWRLINKDDDFFCNLYYVLDNLMKERVAEGLGKVQSAEPISSNMEEKMWESGVLGDKRPDQVGDTLLYMLGVNLGLHGGEEHKVMCRPGFGCQFEFITDSDGYKCLQFVENVKSKTNQGGLKRKLQKPEVVNMYPNVNPSRCVIQYYELYVAHLPEGGKHGDFYLYEKKKWDVNDKVWNDDRCIGINPLRGTVKRLCKLAGFNMKNIHNHSLHSSCCSRLFVAGVDEQLIKEISGHRSNAVRMYKHTLTH